MRKPVSPRRDFQQLERRRQQAARYFAAGEMTLADVARQLQVSPPTVSRWYAAWQQGGAAALRGAGRAGRLPKLDHSQQQQLTKALRQGARAHGFATDLWTLSRVAMVIQRLTGVHYHPGHVWRMLGAMDWSRRPSGQRAAARAPEKGTWSADRWTVVKRRLAAARMASPGRSRGGSQKARRSRRSGPAQAKRRS